VFFQETAPEEDAQMVVSMATVCLESHPYLKQRIWNISSSISSYIKKISRCIRSSRLDPDYAIFLPQIVSFRIGWWVSNTVSYRSPRKFKMGVS
jgi:hypothetical protein